MMAAGDRHAIEYVQNEIKSLSESDIRDRMKANFDKKAEGSEWLLSISDALDKAMDCTSKVSYEDLLLEVGGSTHATTGSTESTAEREIADQISAGLLNSEHLKEMKKELFREWDNLRLEKKMRVESVVELMEQGITDKQMVTMKF